MNYLSVCSGIEAATVAWHPLGWNPVAFSEIESFPSQVLKHHYPTVPNMGDMTKFKEWQIESNVDVLVGGTPCQSFSVAGLRKGLDDPRGNLMLTYLAIAKQHRPRWLVWENVPGLLSSSDGRDFGSFLGGLAICGYGFAYRVLDAQYFGVAQRRKRVFVVGHFGDWRPAAAVLFERHSLQGHPAPSREKRQSAAASVGAGAVYGGSDQNTADTVTSKWAKGSGGPAGNECGLFVAQPIVVDRAAFNQGANAQYKFRAEHSETMDSLVARGPHAVLQPIPIHDQATRHAGKNGDKTMGKGNGLGIGHPGEPMNTLTKGDRHAVAQPIVFSGQMSNPQTDVDMTQTLQAKNPMAVMQPMAYNISPGKGALKEDIHITDADATKTLDASASNPAMHQGGTALLQSMAVRRLTPVECERLQGFGDNYTDIKSKNKPTPDGPRYKALGNSMAVPVMAWIGARIQQYEDMQ